MKTALALALVAAMATAGCTGKDDDVATRAFLEEVDFGRVPQAAISDLPVPAVAFLGELTSPQMKSARALAVGPDGAIFVADPLGQSVHKFSAAGQPAGRIPVGLPLGVAVDRTGRVFVSDASTGAVRIFDTAGTPVGMLGSGEGELDYPMGLAWDPTDETILVADRDAGVIEVFTTSGTPMFTFGSPGTGAGQLTRPIAVVVDNDGARYFVVDAGNFRIQSFDRAGSHLGTFGTYGSDKGQLSSPAGIALDRVGRLYVTDTFQSIVQALDTSGGHVAYIGAYGKNYGQLALSTDAVIDAYNRLLVTSYRTSKVVIFGIDDFTQPRPEAPPIAATVTVTPPTLNGRSRAEYVHVIIDLPEYDVRAIDIASVRLRGLARVPGTPVVYDDVNGDQEEDLVLRFSRAALLAALPGPGTHVLPLSGSLDSGGTFLGEVGVQVLEEVP